MANKQPTTELNGDLDLFGDGSVYIHRGFARAWKPNAPIRLDWSEGEGASLSRLGYFGGAG